MGLVGAGGLALATTRLAPRQETAPVAETSASDTALDQWPVGETARVWSPPAGLTQTNIWPGEAPNADADAKPESVLIAETPEALYDDRSEAILNVSRPTMTVFPPKGPNTGAAVVVFPGGGFRALAITLEGTEVCAWITARGMTCVLSKYRVPFSNHSWDPACRCVRDPRPAPALQDAQRTIRLVRARAAELGVDPAKIGVMGFSAGGYLVAQTSNIFEPE